MMNRQDAVNSAVKFLILSPDFPLWEGGVAVFAEKLATGFHKAGHSVTVITPKQLPGDEGHDANLPFPVIRTRNVKARYFKYYYAQWKVGQYLQRNSVDVILAATWYPYGNAALRSAPQALSVVIAHGNDFLDRRWRQPFWDRRMKSAFSRVDLILAPSNETRAALHARVPGLGEKVHLLFPGVDPGEFTSETGSPGKSILLSLGRVVERKGQDMVIRALPHILSEFPDVEYWIAGRGPYLEALQSLTASLNLQQHVRFLGFVKASDRMALYQQSTIYLMPSRADAEKGDFEGFGITFLEANACGKPVIGGRSGGVADAIVDGVTGFLVDPVDPLDIANKALQLLRDPNLAARMGRQGRERVEHELNWENRSRKVLEIIRSYEGD